MKKSVAFADEGGVVAPASRSTGLGGELHGDPRTTAGRFAHFDFRAVAPRHFGDNGQAQSGPEPAVSRCEPSPRQNRSKICFLFSTGTLGPLSETVTLPSSDTATVTSLRWCMRYRVLDEVADRIRKRSFVPPYPNRARRLVET